MILLLLFSWILSCFCEGKKQSVRGGSISAKVKPSCSDVLSCIFVSSSVWRVWRSIGGIPNKTLWSCSTWSLCLPIIIMQEVCPFNIYCTYSVLTILERQVLSWFSVGPLRDRELGFWLRATKQKGCSNLKRFLSPSLHASSCITYPLLLLEHPCPL